MDHDPRLPEVEVVVPVGSGEEDLLFGETLSQFAQLLAGDDPDGALLIVKSEYGEDGLVKKVIFEHPSRADRFRDLWQAARSRLGEPS